MLSIKELVTEEQDPKVIEKVLPKVQEYCTSNEEVQYIAVQKKTLGINFSPDCIALTNKRIILIRPKSFGLSLDFKDFSWMNVADVHMKEGVFAATITIKTTSGQTDSMEDIPKAQARRLYRFAQEMEESKKEERRQRDLEDKRAIAGGGITESNIKDITNKLKNIHVGRFARIDNKYCNKINEKLLIKIYTN